MDREGETRPAAAEAADAERTHWSRRRFLALGAGAVVTAVSGDWLRRRHADLPSAEVVVTRATRYESDLAAVIGRGLRELGIGPPQIAGRRILLKPNLVEPHSGVGHVNTHPLVVRAAAVYSTRLPW